MTRYHIIIENSDKDIVGQFDTGSENRRNNIVDNLPSDLAVKTERRVPEKANLGNSIDAMSDNIVNWDPRLNQL